MSYFYNLSIFAVNLSRAIFNLTAMNECNKNFLMTNKILLRIYIDDQFSSPFLAADAPPTDGSPQQESDYQAPPSDPSSPAHEEL